MSTRILLVTAALVFSLGAAGCSGDQPATRDSGTGGETRARPGGSGSEAGPDSGPGADSGGPNVTAEASLEERAAGVSLHLTLNGLAAGERYPAQVREGRCADMGPIRVPLGRVTAGADGTGSMRMTVGADRLPDGPISVHVQNPDGSPVACADIDAATG